MLGLSRAALFVLALLALVLFALILAYMRARDGPGHGYRGGSLLGGADDDRWEPGDDNSEGWGEVGPIDGGAAFRLRMRDPGYTAALEGKKTVEGRLDKSPFNRLKAGDAFVVARSRPQGDTAEYAGQRRFDAVVRHVKKYPTYAALLEGEGLKAVAPEAKTAAAATAAFRAFTDEAAEKEHGLIAIAFERAK